MVKHIVSVCIFCFLCATHSPCASHADVTHGGGKQYHDNRIPYKESNDLLLMQQQQDTATIDHYAADDREEVDDDDDVVKAAEDGLVVHRFRKDISSSFSSSSNNKLNQDDYLHKIFTMYGDGKTLNFEAFQKLMRQLELGSAFNNNNNNNHNDEHRHEHHQQHDNDSMCLNREKLYDSIRNDTSNENGIIDGETFAKVCPAILYSLINENCTHDASSSSSTQHKHNEDLLIIERNQTYAWIWSALAVLLISACGILGLAVIPVMQKTFYEPLLQFLVALAVGTLAGDALLHLLPHAMMSHADHEHQHHHNERSSHHDDVMWKGFVAMLGLIFFFLMERIVMLAAKWRKKQQLKDKLPTRLKVIKPEISTQLTNAAEKQCKHKYSSFPYCYDEIKMDLDGIHEDRVFQVGEVGENWDTTHNHTSSTLLSDLTHSHNHHHQDAFKLPHGNGQTIEKNQNMTECPNDVNNTNCSEINKMLTSDINKIISDNNKDDTDSVEYTVILREHENPHHGHSHSHGHVHAAPKTMSSVAWMVIMGDGLHNFTDGMAIGAAFASSTAGGFSTAVAVFCHELPHELGDFAMLLKAGMSMKQALYYNMLSSILCLFGNIFGLWLGNTEYASSWVFAAAAGMFLYIALVDMIPELSSGHEAEGTLLQCILHLGGLLLGFGIMTLIALYEHDLKSIFNE